MSCRARSNRKGSRRVNKLRRGTFETLKARLALAVDLGFAGVFQTLDTSDTAVLNTAYDNRGGGLITDGAGNRYVSINGRSTHSVDLDPGPAVDAVTLDAAIVKLNPNGSVAWKAAFDSGPDTLPVMRILHTVDANQNVYLTGEFRGTVDIDPGPGVANITSINGGADFSFYMAKLNSAGQLMWFRTLLVNHLEPKAVAVDAEGSFIIANNLTGVVPFDADPGPGQALIQQAASYDTLLLKYNADGNFVWARQIGNAGATQLGNNLTLGVNDMSDVFISQVYQGTLDIDPGTGTYNVTNGDTATDRYLTRLDSAGNFVSGYTTEGPGSVGFRDFGFEDDGSIVISGSFTGTTDFQPGSGSLSLTSTGSNGDGLVLKLNADASVAWVRQFGGLGERVTDTDLDDAGNVYLGGYFNLSNASQSGATADFDPGPGVYTLTPPASYETAFVLSLTGDGDFRWAAPLGGNAGRAQVQGLSVTPDGKVQLSGTFNGLADFNPNPGLETWINSGARQSVFVATLTQSDPDPAAPVVDAGPNQTILVTGTASLDGTATDDGLPNPLTTTWSLFSGPGSVTFGNASAVDTTATFSTIGTYLLKLEATDGQFTTADFVQIVVNPVITTLTATADTYLDGGNTTTNYGASASLILDGKPDDGAILKWDLSSIPAGSTLQSATLSVNVTGTSADTYEIYEVKRTWTESQATWKKANSATNWQTAAQGALDRGSTVLGTITASTTGIRSVVLNAAGLAVVQGWVNSPADNFGFILQDYANTTADDLIFSSREATVAANRPQLQMVYIPPSQDTTVPPPRIDTFSASQAGVSVGTPVTLTAVRENDAAHQPQTVSFYRDNGDGVLVVGDDALVATNTDPYLGPDYTKWIVTAQTTGLAPGNYTFFVQASSAGGDVQAAVDVEVFGLETVNFDSTNVPKTIADKTTITSTLTVPSSFSILDVDVTLNISHAKDADLDVYLIGPTGTRVWLFGDVGAAGHNFSGTIMDDEAATAIAFGAAPFTGRFRPQGSLSLFDGQNAAGVWTLEVTDDAKKNTGTLNSWSLQFTREAMPIAVAGSLAIKAQAAAVATLPSDAPRSAATAVDSQLSVTPASSNLLVLVLANSSPTVTTQPLASAASSAADNRTAEEHHLAATDLALAALGNGPLRLPLIRGLIN